MAAPGLPADGIIIVEPPPDVPPVRLDEALTIKYHRVTVTIDDQVATTRVDQVFVNENPWTAEGTYIFPLPKGAAVNEFVMWVDGTPMTGEILQADEARQIYDDIVQPSARPGSARVRRPRPGQGEHLSHSRPAEERRIELEYSQVLPVDNGLVHYVYPLSTEKYLGPSAGRGDHPGRDRVAAMLSRRSIRPATRSSSSATSDYRALVGLEQSDVLPDKDFELYYSVSPEAIGFNLLSLQRGRGGRLFPAAGGAQRRGRTPMQVVAKNVIFVLDVSGSMEGEKLEQAKNAAACSFWSI